MKGGTLPKDDDYIPLQVGNGIVTQDITGTPITSPVTMTASSIKTLKVPNNAAELSIYCDADLLLSEDSNFNRYDLIPGGQKEVIGISKTEEIYLKNDGSVSVTVYFKFIIL